MLLVEASQHCQAQERKVSKLKSIIAKEVKTRHK